jgi:hypothetical protein
MREKRNAYKLLAGMRRKGIHIGYWKESLKK